MTADRRTTQDPLGRRALFSPPTGTGERDVFAPTESPAPAEGVRALYSPGTGRRLGTVRIECSECLVHSRRSVIDLGIRLLKFSVWIPGRKYSRWLVCPACDRRTWARVHWLG